MEIYISLIVAANDSADAVDFSSTCVLMLRFFRFNTGQLTSERYSTQYMYGQHRRSQHISGYLSYDMISTVFSADNWYLT